MRVPNMINTAVWSGTIAAAMVAATVAFGGTAHAATPIDHPGCIASPSAGPGSDQGYYCDRYAVDMTGGSDPVAECLLSVGQGFHGRTDDHSETIYATSAWIDSCVDYVDNVAGEYSYAHPLTPGITSV